ncbi:MAG: hypothetical protein MHMPM18_002388, partial [Marteilia pararefringens]
MSYFNRTAHFIIIDCEIKEIKKAIEIAKNIVDANITTRGYDFIGVLLVSAVDREQTSNSSHYKSNIIVLHNLSTISWEVFDKISSIDVDKLRIQSASMVQAVCQALQLFETTLSSLKTVKSFKLHIISDRIDFLCDRTLSSLKEDFKNNHCSIDLICSSDFYEANLDCQLMKRAKIFIDDIKGKISAIDHELGNFEYEPFPISRIVKNKGVLTIGKRILFPIFSFIVSKEFKSFAFEKISISNNKESKVKKKQCFSLTSQCASVDTVDDSNNDNIEVSYSDCIKAFKYCDSYIPVDEMFTIPESGSITLPSGFHIISFLNAYQVDVNLSIGPSCRALIGSDSKSDNCLLHLAKCMFDANKYAIAKFILNSSNNTEKLKLVLMFPDKNLNLFCVSYPFLQDYRFSNFPQRINSLMPTNNTLKSDFDDFIQHNMLSCTDILDQLDPELTTILRIQRTMVDSKFSLSLDD